MKFTQEDKQELFNQMDLALLPKIEKIRAHRRKNLGKDVNVRFRWDLFWALNPETINSLNLYGKGYNYSHIDTALKSYVENRPQFSI